MVNRRSNEGDRRSNEGDHTPPVPDRHPVPDIIRRESNNQRDQHVGTSSNANNLEQLCNPHVANFMQSLGRLFNGCFIQEVDVEKQVDNFFKELKETNKNYENKNCPGGYSSKYDLHMRLGVLKFLEQKISKVDMAKRAKIFEEYRAEIMASDYILGDNRADMTGIIDKVSQNIQEDLGRCGEEMAGVLRNDMANQGQNNAVYKKIKVIRELLGRTQLENAREQRGLGQQIPLQRFRQDILHMLRLDPSQPAQRRGPQWPELRGHVQNDLRQQRPEQQTQWWRFRGNILRMLCLDPRQSAQRLEPQRHETHRPPTPEQVDVGAMNLAQLNDHAQILKRQVQRLPDGTNLERRQLETLSEKADALSRRMNVLSNLGSFYGSDFYNLNNAAHAVTEVRLSIDGRRLKDLDQRVSREATRGRPNLTHLEQFRQEAKQLQQSERIHQALLFGQFQPERLIRQVRSQDKAIKGGADKIITKLDLLDLLAMSPAQLNRHAHGLERQARNDLQRLSEGTNQERRERKLHLEQLVTKALDTQEHVQKRLAIQGEADRENLESAKRKTSRIIQLIADRLG